MVANVVVIEEDDYLAHYGILRRSGRYPWGSGGNVAQRSKSFLDYIQEMKNQGLSETEIARGVGMSTTDLRAMKSIAKNESRQENIRLAQKLKEKGWSNTAIGERMGLNESSVRALLSDSEKAKEDVLQVTSKMLKKEVDEKGFLDVGLGVENYIGVSQERLNTALAMLKEEGYEIHRLKVKQLGTGKDTDVKVLGPPGSTQKEIWQDPSKIKSITSYSEDGGRTMLGLVDPLPINPKRVGIVYGDQGGSEADGVIYVRPGVKDVSLDGSTYAQVRVKVGDGHYIKGMATYKEGLPDGIDLLFNTTKSDTGNKLDALKPIKDDPENPWDAQLKRQIIERDSKGKEYTTSVMNIVREEGDWSNWSKTISSQILSKQSPKLAKEHLDMTYERRKAEYDEIMALTNPTVRKKLLEEFADGTDAAAVHLKAAEFKGQNTHVLLPIKSMSPTEIYAPNYRDGERVVLIRFPHGGTFEIPELVVNNRQREAKSIIGNAKDAVGIHSSVAEHLSGADFDGDTVLVIPNRSGKIKSDPILAGLKNFNPRDAYPQYEGMKVMANTQTEMGKISNLITDMTIRGASHDKIARAVRHSMVVIDAEKHKLDYKRSFQDNGIAQLKAEYQEGGASTLISRKKSTDVIPDRVLRKQSQGGSIDPKTGKLVYVETGKINYRTGKPATTRVSKLALTDNAYTLSSGTPIESLYAEHSNKLKALANQARLSLIKTPPLKYSPSSKVAYEAEVASLDAKLATAKRNAPLERQAQIIANATVKAKRQANPNMDADTRKKTEYLALTEARARTGAGKQRIEITKPEWDAIQAGAISNSKLTQILNNANMETVRELATPVYRQLMTPAKTQRAQSMLASGYTRAEVASQLGVSLSTLDRGLNG